MNLVSVFLRKRLTYSRNGIGETDLGSSNEELPKNAGPEIENKSLPNSEHNTSRNMQAYMQTWGRHGCGCISVSCHWNPFSKFSKRSERLKRLSGGPKHRAAFPPQVRQSKACQSQVAPSTWSCYECVRTHLKPPLEPIWFAKCICKTLKYLKCSMQQEKLRIRHGHVHGAFRGTWSICIQTKVFRFIFMKERVENLI